MIMLLVQAPTSGSAQLKQGEAWQTHWPTYVAELAKYLEKGINPSEDARFRGKEVVFEGILEAAFVGDQPDARIRLAMIPQEVRVAASLLPDSTSADPPVMSATAKRLVVIPNSGSRDAWKRLRLGATVKVRGTLGGNAVVPALTTEGTKRSATLFLFVNEGELVALR
jgi:hypothetical protein